MGTNYYINDQWKLKKAVRSGTNYEDTFTRPQNLHVQKSCSMPRSPHTEQSHVSCSTFRSSPKFCLGAVFGMGGLLAAGRAPSRGSLLEKHISHVTLCGWFTYVQVAHAHSTNSGSGSDIRSTGTVGGGGVELEEDAVEFRSAGTTAGGCGELWGRARSRSPVRSTASV